MSGKRSIVVVVLTLLMTACSTSAGPLEQSGSSAAPAGARVALPDYEILPYLSMFIANKVEYADNHWAFKIDRKNNRVSRCHLAVNLNSKDQSPPPLDATCTVVATGREGNLSTQLAATNVRRPIPVPPDGPGGEVLWFVDSNTGDVQACSSNYSFKCYKLRQL